MPTDTPPTMHEVEARMGLTPIDELLAKRRSAVETVATLRAKYGSFGTFEHERKIELARIKARIRAELTASGANKVTNDQIDDLAHADPAYVDAIITATQQRAEWVRLEAKIEAIDMYIQRGQAIARFLAAEARL